MVCGVAKRILNFRNKEDDGCNETVFLLGGKTYLILKRRWGILALTCAILFLDIFSVSFFARVNDAASVYFKTSPAVTDLLSTINLLARGVFALMAGLFSDVLNFREQALAASSTVFVGSVMIAVGVSSRVNFAIVVIGQITNGLGSAISIPLASTVSTNWFPKWERGKAVSLPLLGRRLSFAAASLSATISLRFMASHSGAIEEIDSGEKGMVQRFKHSYVIIFAVVGVAGLVTYFASQFFVTNHPPHLTQTNSRTIEMVTNQHRWNLLTSMKEFVKLFRNKTFLFVILCYCLHASRGPVINVLLTSIVLEAFPALTDEYVGVLFSVSILLGSLGIVTSGAVLDRFHRTTCTFSAGAIALMSFIALFSVSLFIRSTVLMYMSILLINYFGDFTYICISYLLLEAMEEEAKSIRLKAFIIAGSVPLILNPAYTIAIRKLMDACGPSLAVLFPIPFHMLSLILWIFAGGYFRLTSSIHQPLVP